MLSLKKLFCSVRSEGRHQPSLFLQTFHNTCRDDMQTDLFEFSEKTLNHGNHYIQLYCVLCWMIFSKKAWSLCINDEANKNKLERFHRIISQGLLFSLHGLKQTGKVFDIEMKQLLIMRRIEFYVLNVSCVYMHL